MGRYSRSRATGDIRGGWHTPRAKDRGSRGEGEAGSWPSEVRGGSEGRWEVEAGVTVCVEEVNFISPPHAHTVH